MAFKIARRAGKNIRKASVGIVVRDMVMGGLDANVVLTEMRGNALNMSRLEAMRRMTMLMKRDTLKESRRIVTTTIRRRYDNDICCLKILVYLVLISREFLSYRSARSSCYSSSNSIWMS